MDRLNCSQTRVNRIDRWVVTCNRMIQGYFKENRTRNGFTGIAKPFNSRGVVYAQYNIVGVRQHTTNES